MNDKFDELAKNMARCSRRALLSLALAGQLAWPARADDFRRGPLVALSDPDPLVNCPGGLGFVPANAQEEPSVAVNPANLKNIVAAWIGGGAKGIVAAVTFDGAKRWQQVVIPGVNGCSGSAFYGAVDPWVSFAPNGDAYLVSLALFAGTAIALNKSSDGGLHWSDPTILDANTDSRFLPDAPSVTADPTNARFAYAVWERRANGNRGPGAFSRTTDGGRTWEQARVIYDPGTSDQSTGYQIVVLPDGALVCFFVELLFSNGNGGSQKDGLLSLIRSRDKGQTWSPPIRAAKITVFDVTDPDTGHAVANSSSYPPFGDVAVDPHNGNLYAVWEDTRFSNGQHSSIAFAMSSDGGFNWSTPIAVNKTQGDIAPSNRQAWMPTIAVATDGTIGVAYYDFRLNDASPGLPTDYWLVHCHPTLTALPTDTANWGSETRLTDASFDLEKAFDLLGSYFLGDYMGLAAAGNDFVAVFNQASTADPGTIFFSRAGP